MTDKSPTNLLASLHQRLLNASKRINRPFNDVVMYYAIERFLYRLSQSHYADRVVLKGALMLQVWDVPTSRVTRDIDLLGKFSNDLEKVREVVRHLCSVKVKDDGLAFDPATVEAARISDDADYQGARATFRGNFGKMPLAMQIDFGFSDVITPAPTQIIYPTILNDAPAQLLAYNRETAIAEKFEAMVKLGELNSRMKDFFDVWLLAQSFEFDGRLLADAIQSTFARRQSRIELDPACFADRFVNSPIKTAQWKGFIRTSRVQQAMPGFPELAERVRDFLRPIAMAVAQQQPFDRKWRPRGPWE